MAQIVQRPDQGVDAGNLRPPLCRARLKQVEISTGPMQMYNNIVQKSIRILILAMGVDRPADIRNGGRQGLY
jgi:hypothetical protein